MATFPKLYKKTSTGAIQYWSIWTEGNVIKTAYGQVGGAEQVTSDTINEGKNVGRSNETTAEQQAELEAKSHWDKKKKRSYVEDINRAENAETDIVGGLDVMLAHTYSKQGHKIKWPAYAQAKLDGIRMIAIIENGSCTLWTRTRKPITGVPHIQKELESLFPNGYHVLDGECYNHSFKKDFEKIVHFVRQEEPAEGHEIVEYHIYDLPQDGTFEERVTLLNKKIPDNAKYLRKVSTVLVASEEDAVDTFNQMVSVGYEGLMLRNKSGLYVGKRSYDLQKLKEFEDAEFEIVDVEEGRGKLTGHVGAFVLKGTDGNTFKAKMMGEVERLKDYYENHNLWQGKKLTVKYQGLTAYGVPRFPVGVSIRDYE
jgi:DNA ligase-1